MFCDYGRPVTEGSEIQLNLWVLIVMAIVPFKTILFVTWGQEMHIKRSDQDVEVHKTKRRYMRQILMFL